MIQKSYIITGSQSQSFIGVPCDPFIFLQLFPLDPPVFFRILHQSIFHRSILRTGIYNTQFPVLICLVQQRIYHLPEIFFRCLICRYHNTDLGLIFPFSFFLFFQFFYIRSVGLIPRAIRDFFWFKPLMKPYPEFFRPVMFQITEAFLNGIR